MRAFVNLSGIDYELDVSDGRIINSTGYDIPAGTAIYCELNQPDKPNQVTGPEPKHGGILAELSKEDTDVLIFQANHGTHFQKAICRAVLLCLETLAQK